MNPPSTPTPRNGRTSGPTPTAPSTAISAPISRQPVTLTPKVAHGKPVGGCGTAAWTPARASAPSTPPAAIAPSTVAGVRGQLRRSAATRRSTSGSTRTRAVGSSGPPTGTRTTGRDRWRVRRGSPGSDRDGGPHRRHVRAAWPNRRPPGEEAAPAAGQGRCVPGGAAGRMPADGPYTDRCRPGRVRSRQRRPATGDPVITCADPQEEPCRTAAPDPQRARPCRGGRRRRPRAGRCRAAGGSAER